jgi:hypothetical protein
MKHNIDQNLSAEDLKKIIKDYSSEEEILSLVVCHPNCNDEILDIILESRNVGSIVFFANVVANFKIKTSLYGKIWNKIICPPLNLFESIEIEDYDVEAERIELEKKYNEQKRNDK